VNIETIPISQTIAKRFNASTGSVIIEIFNNVVTRELPGEVVVINGFLKNLKAHARIGSLAPVKLPNFTLEDSETDKLYKTLDIQWNSARKQLNLYLSDNQNAWYQVGAVSLLNPSGYPYRIYNLMDLLTENLAEELGENGRIGISIQDVGYGELQGTDEVVIHGSYIQEVTVNTGKIAIASCVDFSKVIETESTVIVNANASRKEVLLTNSGQTSVYLNLGNVAVWEQGLLLTPGGSFNLAMPYYGVISAIALDGASLISGIECV
jgi:hypothetical protein